MATFVKEGRVRYHADLLLGAGNWRMRLYTNVVAVSADTDLADLDEATFSGYAATTPVWGAAAIDGLGRSVSVGNANLFQHNGGGVGNTVRGWYLMDNANGKLLFVEAFGAPRTLNAADHSVTITPTMLLSELP